MPRNDKLTRAKGMPPKVKVAEQANEPRSYEYQKNTEDRRFNDSSESVLVFGTMSQGDIWYPAHIPVGVDVDPEYQGSLEASGRIIAGVSDKWMEPTSGKQHGGLYEPFTDDSLVAGGLSADSEFYRDVSDMDKFEVDISTKYCSFDQVISQSHTGTDPDPTEITYEDNYPMAYFNFARGRWEGIGTGWPLQARFENTEARRLPLTWAKEYLPVGFAPSILTLPNETYITGLTSSTPALVATSSQLMAQNYPWGKEKHQTLAGMPTTNYGFPHAPKFHATSSQLLDMSGYIDRPFRVTAIVAEIDGAEFTMYESVTSDTAGYHLTSSIFPACINNFFVLKQTEIPQGSSVKTKSVYSANPYHDSSDLFMSWSLPHDIELTAWDGGELHNIVTVNTIREMITWAGVTTHTADIELDDVFQVNYMSGDKYSQLTGSTLPLADVSWRACQYLTSLGNPTGIYQTEDLNANIYPLRNMERDMLVSLDTSITSSIAGLSWGSARKIRFEMKPKVPRLQPLSVYGPQKNASSYSSNYSDYVGFYDGGRIGAGFDGVGKGIANGEHQSAGVSPSVMTGVLGNPVVEGEIVEVVGLPSYSGSILLLKDLFGEANTSLDQWAFDITNGNNIIFNQSGRGLILARKPSETFVEDTYVLYPTDKLIFGWQLPLVDAVTQRSSLMNDNWVKMSLPAIYPVNASIPVCGMSFDGPAKVTFYGRYLDDTDVKNSYDTNSVTTHMIGEG